MNIDCIQLKIKKRAFLDAVSLTSAMAKYEVSQSDENLKQIESLVTFTNGMPLPSGRWGNATALALDTNHYVCAKYLIDNAKVLNLATDRVSSDLGWSNAWSLEDEYLFSLITYDEEELTSSIFSLIDRFPGNKNEYLMFLNTTKEAVKYIENRLNVSEKVKKYRLK